MTDSTLPFTVSISGIRVMLGASRGLDQPTVLALLGFPAAPAPAAAAMLSALDAGLCNRVPSRVGHWERYRDERLTGWNRGGQADAPAVADLILWIWMSLQHEYGNPSTDGTLRAVATDQFELAAPYIDPDFAQVTLRCAVDYVNRVVAAASSGIDPAAAPGLRDYFETAGSGITSPLVNTNTRRLLGAANRLGIPWLRLTHDVYHLGWGCKSRRLCSTHTDRTPALAQQIASNKAATRYLLTRAGFPKIRYGLVESEAMCVSLAERIGYPVVVKPANQERGIGVATRLASAEQVRRAYREASQYGAVLVEQFFEGNDHRLLVFGGRLLAAAHRVPGGVTGNGRDSVRALVDQANTDPRRGAEKGGLMRMELDEEADEVLGKQGLTRESVVESGRFVPLREGPTVVRGGVPVDVTGSVHPDNRRLVERACRVVGLDIGGVDFLCPDISRSWREVGAAIIEVNSSPDLISHSLAQPERDIYEEVIGGMFDGGTGRIPAAAVAGGAEAGEAGRLLHRILRVAGMQAGVATTAGVWIGDELAVDRDMSAGQARDVLLTDPGVEAAVIETPAAALMSQGHPCDRYAVAALVNMSSHDLPDEAAAQVMTEVLERTTEAVAINADDARCLALVQAGPARRRMLVSEGADGAALQAHLAAGGEAVFVDRTGAGPAVVLAGGGTRRRLTAVTEHRTGAGCLPALFAAAMAHGMGVDADAIHRGLLAADAAPGQALSD